MTSTDVVFPPLDATALASGLASVFASQRSTDTRDAILGRQSNVNASSFASEVISCELGDGAVRRVFCKYGEIAGQDPFGDRGGIAYEAAVYRHMLEPLRATAPSFYGAHVDDARGLMCLFLEYVDGGMRLSDAHPFHSAMVAAADWLGRFHASAAIRSADATSFAMIAHDDAYYHRWAGRIAAFCDRRRERLPWLRALSDGYEELMTWAATSSRVIIHGEFYPSNILVKDGAIVPIDWESAAIGFGELDFASLTEAWPDETVVCCENAYRDARWPSAKGVPSDFARRVNAARLHWAFRWLVRSQAKRLASSEMQLQFVTLRAVGAHLGLIT